MPISTTSLTAIKSSSMTNFNLYSFKNSRFLVHQYDIKKAKSKRHSISVPLLDTKPMGEESSDTKSLPTTPVFIPSTKNFMKLKSNCTKLKDAQTQENIDALLSTSASSGYCSGYSSDSSSTYFNFSDIDFPVKNDCQEEFDFVNIPFDDQKDFTTSDSFTEHFQIPSSSSSGTLKRFANSPIPYESAPVSTPPSLTNSTEIEPSNSIPVQLKQDSSVTPSSSSTKSGLKSKEVTRRRVKDSDGFIRRAACVCVNDDETKVVLISRKNEGGGWLVPGGGLESGEGDVDAAVREAWEEAGVTGDVRRCLGVFQLEDVLTRKKKRTTVYVLAVQEQHSDFPEAELGRVREWFPIDMAIGQLSGCRPHQIPYLRAL